jgi:hypothetical protein
VALAEQLRSRSRTGWSGATSFVWAPGTLIEEQLLDGVEQT